MAGRRQGCLPSPSPLSSVDAAGLPLDDAFIHLFRALMGVGGWVAVEGRAKAFILERDAEEELNLERRKSFHSPGVVLTLSLLSAAKRWL